MGYYNLSLYQLPLSPCISSLFEFLPSDCSYSLLVFPFPLVALFLTPVPLLHMHNLAGSKTNKIFNLQSPDGTFCASEAVNLVRLTSWPLAEGREEWEKQQDSC